MKLSLLKELNDQYANGTDGDHPAAPASPEALPEPQEPQKTSIKLSEIQKIVLVKAVLAQKAFDDQGAEVTGFKHVDLKGEQEVAAVEELQHMGILETTEDKEIVKLTPKALGCLKQEGLVTPEAESITDPNQLTMQHLTDEAQQLVDEINNSKGNGLAQDQTAAGQTANAPVGAAPGLPGDSGLGAAGGGGMPMNASFKNYLLADKKYSYLIESNQLLVQIFRELAEDLSRYDDNWATWSEIVLDTPSNTLAALLKRIPSNQQNAYYDRITAKIQSMRR